MQKLSTLLPQSDEKARSLTLLTTEQKAAADAYAETVGVPGAALMENAGAAAAHFINRLYPHGEITFLVGFGNNGGDGFVAARLLAKNGRRVKTLQFAPHKMTSSVAIAARNAWSGQWAEIAAGGPPKPEELGDVVADCLFGTGLNRALPNELGGLAELCRSKAAKVVALDCPSGLNGNNGELGKGHFHADHTIAFAAAQPGHYLYPGREACGEITVADIGIPNQFWRELEPKFALNHPLLWRAKLRKPNWQSNKYSRGHLLIGGGEEMSGAARLAGAGALAALKVGGGAVTIAVPQNAESLYAATSPEIILRKFADLKDWEAMCRRPNIHAIAVGSGGGGAAAPMAKVALKTTKPCVVDADAITRLGPELPKLLHRNCVWTPHSGEFAKVFPALRPGLEAMEAKFEGTLLLKGATTIVTDGDTAIINAEGPPTLATAGSGDVLSGIIGGLAAGGLGPYQAAAAGCWLHGAAARFVGDGLIASELPFALPKAIAAANNCEL